MCGENQQEIEWPSASGKTRVFSSNRFIGKGDKNHSL